MFTPIPRVIEEADTSYDIVVIVEGTQTDGRSYKRLDRYPTLSA
jgi:hypothetical protein